MSSIPDEERPSYRPPPAPSSLTLEQVLKLPATLTVKQTATVLGISRGAAYEAVHRGEVPSVRIGSRILIPTAPILHRLGIDPSPQPTPPPTPSSEQPGAQELHDHGLDECLRRVGQALLAGITPRTPPSDPHRAAG